MLFVALRFCACYTGACCAGKGAGERGGWGIMRGRWWRGEQCCVGGGKEFDDGALVGEDEYGA